MFATPKESTLRSSRALHLSRLVFLLASSSSAACQRADDSPKRTVRESVAMRVSLDSIFLTSHSGIKTEERAVVRDSASWARMRTRLLGMQPLARPLPQVAFDSSLVVVAATGGTFSGHSIHIDSAEVEGGELKIYVRETIHEPCSQTDMSVAYPAHAVKVRRPAEAVRFVNDSTVWKCPKH